MSKEENDKANEYYGKIIYTKVDEAPALATYSFLPIIKAFTKIAGVNVETRDISLAGRIIANFPENLTENQKISNDLVELGKLVKKPEANIIKLPCISASIPQLKAAIKELQKHGYNLPDYPEDPQTEADKEIKARYDKIKGSAVNPVLREGNSDRRVPGPVKNYAKKNPHPMGKWTKESKSHVAHMSHGDLRSNEKSTTITKATAGDARIEFTDQNGNKKILKEKTTLLDGEIIDATVMSKQALRMFLKEQVQDAKKNNVLFSVHLKATMMKVSDPIIFGHVVSVFFKDVFEKHASVFAELGINPNNGLGDLYTKLKNLSEEKRAEIEADIQTCYKNGPKLAMVNSDKGITNIHVPSDVIIDASMPAAIRNSGRMWGPDGELYDTKFVIPDSSYASVYQEVIDFCKKHGAFNPTTMGTVQNVGLMAQKAEEYGSHDKTFQIPSDGTVRIIAASGKTLLEHSVEEGDIWRMCQVKDLPIQDWIKLAVTRAKETGMPAVFWLNKNRAHDAQLIEKVNRYLADLDTKGLEIHIKSPDEATRFSLQRMKDGKDTISVTGNVLRDYLTDLFPILEVGTSAKMYSIVPLMNGGGLYETGAGGSAPKHVQQFVEEGHLRWDSLGEFLALAVSLEHLGTTTKNVKAKVLAETLEQATSKFLINNKSPSRKVHELDNRGSHFYLTLFWAQALAEQRKDTELQKRFTKLAKLLSDNESKIINELNRAQGQTVDLGGYYKPNLELATKAMRPSTTFNTALEALAVIKD
ncbi:MAG: NADP-dependent isocitrate dehydrogenase [Candidatus Thermoplasmatota archaeon]|nr:NADP-dependent isocitrate dehydrogenase [Candidatus Thermoplasmatota archaeon]MBU1940718.1 NADP-dependent isocitrate dehydrogenase [Candidatus Thermoplasmatota archaeon]